VILTPWQEAELKDQQFDKTQVSDSNFLSWKTGQLDFKNTPLKKVLADIGHYYSIPVTLAPDQGALLESLPVNVRFDNQPIEQVLDEIRLVTGLQTRHEGNTIVFFKK